MKRLRELRESLGRAQKQIAEYLGIDRTTYVKYETGGSEPNTVMLIKLAEYFKCTVDYIIGRTDDPQYEYRTDIPEVLKKVGIDALHILADQNVTAEDIQYLLDFVKRLRGEGKLPEGTSTIHVE